KLRDLYWDILKEVYPLDTNFSTADANEDLRLQESSEQIVSEMEAGEFDYRGDGSWKYAVDEYEGPVASDRVLTPELLPTDLEFGTYVAPGYPFLALAARIQGTVRLALDFDPDGGVNEAQLVEGHPMLAAAAIKAAALWR